ncbi:NAD(P)H-binding protein [Mycolicibacterium hippocampi]|uniref:NAD(P)-binding domain-containing protein n=1 Tax=Mycolicibacterium hippocampi TaxID=659824 RepID=A0A7I9ZN67_9MYCO|nr:NAD(P)H-binding protein [Mycolicibacterium hippocampi]GFH02098.1 hypothetical protein MHIP_25810 [Mycolicibacterium hippocampi]
MIGVTGVTGAVGSRVARLLAAEEAQFVMLARRPDRAPTLSADVRRCAYGDPGSATASLVGVDTLFMVSATESEDRVQEHRTLIEAAAEAGVEHIVYTSFVGAAPDAMFTLARDHFAAERTCARPESRIRSCAIISSLISSRRCRGQTV